MDLHINSFGAYLHVREGMFAVRFKKNDETLLKQFAAGKVRSIILDKGTALSSDAIKLAVTHNVDILFVEGEGVPFARAWHGRPGSTTRIRKRQLEASLNSDGLLWVQQWVCTKLRRQGEFLAQLARSRPASALDLEAAMQKISGFACSISVLQGADAGDIAERLRGFEGNAGKTYFGALATLLPEKHRFKGRSSRPAKDAFNAFLNYGYGMLYSKIERSVMLAGLDPYTGFLHRDDYNTLSFVFDFIEPYRPLVDKAVFKLFSGKKVSAKHYRCDAAGIQLHPEGKRLLVDAFHQTFDRDGIRYKQRNTSYTQAIQAEAHAFANALLNGQPPGAEEQHFDIECETL